MGITVDEAVSIYGASLKAKLPGDRRRALPSNRLEALSGDRSGQDSIRINTVADLL